MTNLIKILPLFIVEILVKKFSSVDTMADGSKWYRVSEAKYPLYGAGIIIRKTNGTK